MEISDIAVFVKVIQTGSFTAAARRLGAPKSTVSAKVSGLERRLGVTLLQRTTRKLHLTDEGQAFFHRCAQALDAIEAAEALAAGSQKTPQGRLSVTAPNDTGRFLAAFLKGFLAKYPEVSVDLVLTNRMVDLVGEGVDVALRAGELRDSSLVARKLTVTRRALFASPAYLAAAGMPLHPRDLSGHQCIIFSPTRGQDWQLVKGKQSVKVKVSGSVSADDIAAIKELAVQDLGIALAPSFICAAEVANGRLVPVLPDWCTEANPICIVYPGQKFQHPKIRAFVEEFAQAMGHYLGAPDRICGLQDN